MKLVFNRVFVLGSILVCLGSASSRAQTTNSSLSQAQELGRNLRNTEAYLTAEGRRRYENILGRDSNGNFNTDAAHLANLPLDRAQALYEFLDSIQELENCVQFNASAALATCPGIQPVLARPNDPNNYSHVANHISIHDEEAWSRYRARLRTSTSQTLALYPFAQSHENARNILAQANLVFERSQPAAVSGQPVECFQQPRGIATRNARINAAYAEFATNYQSIYSDLTATQRRQATALLNTYRNAVIAYTAHQSLVRRYQMTDAYTNLDNFLIHNLNTSIARVGRNGISSSRHDDYAFVRGELAVLQDHVMYGGAQHHQQIYSRDSFLAMTETLENIDGINQRQNCTPSSAIADNSSQQTAPVRDVNALSARKTTPADSSPKDDATSAR